MPQASPELQEKMIARFGNISEAGPEKFLKDTGWTLHKDWSWTHPNHDDLNSIPQDQWDCIVFLVHGWDYGGVQQNAHR